MIRPDLRTALAAVIALAAAVATEQLVRYDLHSRVSTIDITLTSARQGPAEVHVYYQRPPASRGFDTSRFIKQPVTLHGGKQRVTIKMGDTLADLFLVAFETGNAPLTLQSVVFTSHYAPPIKLTGADLLAYFKANDAHTVTEGGGPGVTLTSSSGMASLVSTRPIRFSNPPLRYGLGALAGLLLFFLVLRFDPSRSIALVQLQTRGGAAQSHSLELDGLRGLAALSVVADHTWGLFTGSGLVGVWIFFALSGYLLAIPFVRRPELAFDGDRLQRYFFRRLARIIPMYYTTIFIFYMASGKVQWAIPHLVFVQGDGHLWTIPQEMLFYLLLPGVMIGMALLIRFSFAAAFAALLVATAWLLWDPYTIPFLMNGNPHLRPPFVGWFLGGICVSYLLNHAEGQGHLERLGEGVRRPVGWLALVILVGVFVCGSVTIASDWAGRRVNLAWDYKPYFGAAAAFLVFAAVYARNSAYGAVLRFAPLRSFGIIGFSAYLLHPLLLEVIRKFSSFYLGFVPTGFGFFAATTVLTWFVAGFTFSLIERPFLERPRPTA